MSFDEKTKQADPIDCSLDLLRRLPPSNIDNHLRNVIKLLPDLTDDLLSAVDQPLKIATCSVTGKPYLLCDYNRDGDSFRSPWSNEYEPALADGSVPSPEVRKLEISANDAFDTYKDLYYDGGVSSVYMWDLDDGFAAVVLIKNDIEGEKSSWDSVHVIEIQETVPGKKAIYKLTSTVMVYLGMESSKKYGEVGLSGSLTRQSENEYNLDNGEASHIVNIGKSVEDQENKMRNLIQTIYFGKTKDITNDLRSITSLKEIKKQNLLQSELIGKLAARQ